MAGCLDTLPDSGENAGDELAEETGATATPTSEEPGDESDNAPETPTPGSNSHPLADRVATVTIERVEEDRDRLERLLREAIDFWNDNHDEYVSYSTTLEYRPEEADPDILVSEVPGIEECGLHDDGEFAGCATLLQDGDHAALPAEIELVPSSDDWLYRTVIKHELGHVLGLEHDDEPAEIMHQSLEYRYPEFDQRMEILELRDEWVSEFNSAANALTDAFDAVDADDFETAARKYETASQHYATAGHLIESATEIAAQLSPFEPADREMLVQLLDHERSFIESMQSALELLREGSERIADGEDGYDTYNEGVDAYNETIEQPLPETSEYVEAVGFSQVVVDHDERE